MEKDNLVLLLFKEIIKGFLDSFSVISALKRIDAKFKDGDNNCKSLREDDQTSLARRRIDKPRSDTQNKPVNIIQKKYYFNLFFIFF